jgi:hypothetical protein
LHHLTVDVLRASFFGLKKFAAPGVDERGAAVSDVASDDD